MRERAITALFLLAASACIALLVFGIVAASLSHTAPTVCPPGWHPNTGYLQRPGSCVP